MNARGDSVGQVRGRRLFGCVGIGLVAVGVLLALYAAASYFVTPPLPAWAVERPAGQRWVNNREGSAGKAPALSAAVATVGIEPAPIAVAPEDVAAEDVAPEDVAPKDVAAEDVAAEVGVEPVMAEVGDGEPAMGGIAAVGEAWAGAEAAGPATEPTVEPTLEPTVTPVVFEPAEVPWRITIPALGVDAPVRPVGLLTRFLGDVEVTQWAAPNEFAAGWHNGSALPGGGGNVVLNGHHNIFGAVFGRLVEVEPGAEILVYSGQEVYRYEVMERVILAERDEPVAVRVRNGLWMAPTAEERLTLVTCWPATTNSHRLIVTARPADVGPEEGG